MKRLPWFTVERNKRGREVIKALTTGKVARKADQEDFFPVSWHKNKRIFNEIKMYRFKIKRSTSQNVP